MDLREINFSFAGLHCLRDYGCIYVEKGGHIITPGIARNTYEIAGASGTLIMPGAVYDTIQFDGSLYFMHDPPNQQAAQENLRMIGAWLTNGRQRLVFDYEPHRYYMAEMNDASKWGFSGWIGGGLDVAFDAQPFAYNVQENTATLITTATSNALGIVVDTGEAAPLKLTVKNTGTAAISGVTVTAGGKSAVFSGMHITHGASLDMDMEPPIGAAFSSGQSALSHATRFDYITLAPGANTIAVTLTFGSGAAGAQITAAARGRYL